MKMHCFFSPSTHSLLCCLMIYFGATSILQAQEKKSFAVVGLSHGHSPWFFEWGMTADMSLAAVYEPNLDLVEHFQQRYELPDSVFYTDLQEMLEQTKPDGILVFGAVKHHLEAVEAAAPLGIHVMVEKPLAANLADAQKMAALAEKHHIQLLVNYETSWYASTSAALRQFEEEEGMGQIRKMVFHHGHEGPMEIGVGKEFLDWLTDPVLNGGGALMDFGCYGANIMTSLMHGERPQSVTAIRRTYKPEVYPKVEDEATIIVDYPAAQGIIQASWNWPYGRKDMEIYAQYGYMITEDAIHYRLRQHKAPEQEAIAEEVREGLIPNPFEYFRLVISNEYTQESFSPYTLENNLMVMEILEAAKRSAKLGQKVCLDKEP